ncbi:MAG: hypothetical protein LBS01_09715 [Prevotellaceae bacterium]|jgi:hypothetical protein|nr:hypothetical protein [Prevotellaceae bacterium]
MKTEAEVIQFEKVQTQIKGLYNEIGILSKKNPNDAVNKFKLKFINQSLTEANKILQDKKPYSDFNIFDVDDTPTTSDIVMILEQYYSALESIRCINITKKDYTNIWVWMINGKQSKIETNSSTIK